MLRKFFLFFVLLLLSSCFSWADDSNQPLVSGFDWGDFTMNIPSSWELLKNTNTILPKPANWDIVFDAVSKKLNDGFYRNMLVLRQNIDEDMSSFDFTVWNYIASKKEYFYTKLLAEKNVIIDSKKTKIYQFEARYSDSTPILKFLQTWIVCEKKAFLITIAIEKSNSNMNRYEGLLASFVCKNKEIINQ